MARDGFDIRLQVSPALKQLPEMFEIDDRPDLASLERSLGVIFRKQERDLFRTQGTSGGSTWPNLSPAYAARKPKICGGAIAAPSSPRKKKSGKSKSKTLGKSAAKKVPKRRKKKKSTTKKARGLVVMVCSGELRESLTKETHKSHVKRRFLKPRPTVVFGTQDKKAAWHFSTRNTVQRNNRNDRVMIKDIAKYMREIKLPRIQRVLDAAAKNFR